MLMEKVDQLLRVWEPKSQRYLPLLTLDFDESVAVLGSNDGQENQVLPINKLIFERNTYFKDKKGQFIFENDLVEIKPDVMGVVVYHEQQGKFVIHIAQQDCDVDLGKHVHALDYGSVRVMDSKYL